MHGPGVIRLVEIVRPEFPVRLERDAKLVDANGFLELMVPVQLGRGFQVRHQVRCFVIHGVPDQAGPGADAHFREFQFADRVAPGKIVPVGQVFQYAVEAPPPAVIRAGEAVLAAVLPHQSLRAMAAGVVEPLERAVPLLHHDDRLAHEIVHDVVAGFLELFLAAGDVPDLRPEAFPFPRHELAAVVPVLGNRIAPQQRRVLAVHRQRMLHELVH